jgi:hypothetical protein
MPGPSLPKVEGPFGGLARRRKSFPGKKNPLAEGANLDDVLRRLAFKEVKDLIQFDAGPTASEKK